MKTVSKWPYESLCDLAEIVAGATPDTNEAAYWDGTYFWATPKDLSDLTGIYISDTARKITEKGLRSCATTTLPVGSVLFSSRAPIGHVAINNVPISTNQGFKSFIPSERLYAKYLYFWLKANKSYLNSLGNGATFKEISKSVISKVQIPLPPLQDQIRIAHLLEKVEGLIAKRKEDLAQLDVFLKSVFLEMFGDPVRNEKGWEKKALSQFGKLSTGNTPPRAEPKNYEPGIIEWIKTDNISSNQAFITTATEYLSQQGLKIGRTATPGALLVACIAGSIESIGRAALTNRSVAFNQQINAIQPNSEVNSYYLYVLFKISKEYVQSHATKGMKKILTKGDFEKIEMIKPPLALQNKFATIVEKVESLKTQHQQSFADLESLYGTLSQKAFAGELNLDRVKV